MKNTFKIMSVKQTTERDFSNFEKKKPECSKVSFITFSLLIKQTVEKRFLKMNIRVIFL